jgi:hypothetical protein
MPHVAVVDEPEVKSVSYLDPRGHVHTVERQMANRLGDVRGKVVALLDNGNDTSRFFFDALAEVLQRDYEVHKVILTTKFTSTKPADTEVIQHLAAKADCLVAGVAL